MKNDPKHPWYSGYEDRHAKARFRIPDQTIEEYFERLAAKRYQMKRFRDKWHELGVTSKTLLQEIEKIERERGWGIW